MKRITTPARRPRAIVAAVQAALAVPAWLAVGLAPALAQSTGTQQLDRVEITGSSIKRIEGETALPVQVITREDIARTGASNVEQLLQRVTAAASSGNNVAASSSGAATLGISSVSLRGLSSVRTLVLINGKRVTPYGWGFANDSSSVDVNGIPIAAIERVEILKDGASAVYGSDAIAGVVNFILRKDFRGLEIGAEYGTPTQGSAGSMWRVNGAWGIGDLAQDRFNAMFTVSWQKEKPLFGRDRDFARSGINVDKLQDTTSGNTQPANVIDAATGGAVVSGNPAYPGCPGPYSTLSPVFELFGIATCRFDPSPLVTLLPEVERKGVFGTARLRVGADTELYGEASFTRNEARTVIQPTPISDQFPFPSNHPLFAVAPYNGFNTILLTAASPFYPTAFVQGQTGGATPDLLVRWRAGAIGDRDTTDTADATRLVGGVRGLAAGWDYDLGYLFSRSEIKQTINGGFARYTQLMPLLNSGQINFFGPQTPAGQAALEATQFRGTPLEIETSLQSLYAKGSRDLMTLPAGALAMAVGGELRREKYRLDPIADIQIGDLTGYGGNFRPVDVSRDVTALFGELNVPVARGLEANLAARYDDYEGVGSKTTGKLSLRWQPSRTVLLRTAYGSGFRAPSLLDLFAPVTTGVTPNGQNDPLRCPTTGSSTDCATQFPISQGGNPALKPEQSQSFTFGIVLEPTANVSVGVDWFNIRLEDLIGVVPAATVLGDLNRFGSLVTRGPVDPGFPTLPGPITNISQSNINFGKAQLIGYDLDAKWAIPTASLGRFTLGLTGSYFHKFAVQNPDGSYSGSVDVADSSTGGVIPRWKHYLSLNWAFGAWSTTLAQNFQGSYTDNPSTIGPLVVANYTPPKVQSYTTYDLQTVYSGIRNLQLTVGVRNLLDEDPPYTNSGGTVYFQAGYDIGYADPRGRFVYARVNYKFF